MKKVILSGLFLMFMAFSAASFAVPVNVATSGTATQSSTGTWGGFAQAELAIDGNTDGNYWNGSVSHTLADTNAWWEVDLGSMFDIDSIVIWNRTDCCGDRIDPFSVSILDDFNSLVWSTSFTTFTGNPMTISPLAGTIGQVVRVQLNQTNYLQLAEVQVFSEVPVPAPLALLGLGLVAIGWIRRTV